MPSQNAERDALIKTRYKAGESSAALAREFGISAGRVWQLANNDAALAYHAAHYAAMHDGLPRFTVREAAEFWGVSYDVARKHFIRNPVPGWTVERRGNANTMLISTVESMAPPARRAPPIRKEPCPTCGCRRKH